MQQVQGEGRVRRLRNLTAILNLPANLQPIAFRVAASDLNEDRREGRKQQAAVKDAAAARKAEKAAKAAAAAAARAASTPTAAGALQPAAAAAAVPAPASRSAKVRAPAAADAQPGAGPVAHSGRASESERGQPRTHHTAAASAAAELPSTFDERKKQALRERDAKAGVARAAAALTVARAAAAKKQR